MNGGNDPRGLNLSFRQSRLNFIKTRLKDYYAPSSNDLACLRSLDEIAKKFEHKVFLNATSHDDYLKIIEQKLTQATNIRPALSVTRNQFEGNVISRQNPNIPVIQPRNMAVQNHQYVFQNYSGASELSAISDSGTTNPDQSQLLIDEYRRAKLSYLPELEKWLKAMEGKFSHQVQTVSECDNLQTHIVSVRQMIKLLSIAENQLMLCDKHKLRHNMNKIIAYYNKFVKNGISFSMNQAYQLSAPRSMACTNVTQNTLTGPVLMNQPVISSSTINPGFSSGSVISTEPTYMKSNTILQSPETVESVSQREKRKKSTNATSRTYKKPRSKPMDKSSGNSHESWLNLATLRSKRSSITTPSTPMTPSCGAPEISLEDISSPTLEEISAWKLVMETL